MNRNLIIFPLILTIALLISGCSFHSSMIKEDQMDIPSSYSTEIASPAPPVGEWWKQFNDDELNVLMDEAFKHNLEIAQSYERLQQSLASVRIADSSRGFNLTIEGSGGKARQSGTLGIVREETYSLSAAASYEIDLWGKLKSTTNASQLEALASEEDMRSLHISISAQLAELYFLAVEQRAQLELSNRTIASFQDTLDRVERRYREGLVSAIDVYQSRQNLASAKARRPLFESSLAVTLNAISVLTGSFPGFKIGGNISVLEEAPDFNAGIPSQLLSGRPDIKAAYLRLKASDERVAAAIADRFPSFNLVGTYGGSSNRLRSVIDSPNIFWNILLQAAQPVLDAGRRKAEVDRTKSVFREKLAGYHLTVLNAFKEVEDALAKSKASEERIKMLDENVNASENAYRLAMDNYMQGLTDYLPVLTGQLRLFTVKSNLLAAERQFISDRIQLARALGGEWNSGKEDK